MRGDLDAGEQTGLPGEERATDSTQGVWSDGAMILATADPKFGIWDEPFVRIDIQILIDKLKASDPTFDLREAVNALLESYVLRRLHERGIE